ncbi:hypothetical protein LWI28_017973 [Acer negundo]|uniref:Retrotransposon Copia-like N-terminal domain-containing protein n=1 Tax=Acer negundo TaxID=4023 RepID=A0AAD5IFR9_ACENE|nr:hypothetical protein LWI28_017973 [Acer negundo]
MATSASSSSTAVTVISSSSSAYDVISSGKTIISINIAAQAPLKLTATNYRSWKLQFHTLLIGFDLMGFVDRTRPYPPTTITLGDTTTPNSAHHIWVRQDQLLLNAILGSISPSIIPFIASVKTVHDVWTALANIYAKPSRGHIMRLKGILTNISKGTQSITEYMQHAKSIANELAMLDAPENPEDLTVKILNGLGDEFKDTSSAVRARDSAISFEDYMKNSSILKHFLKQESTRNQRLPITTNYVAKPFSGGHQSNNNHRNYNNRSSTPQVTTKHGSQHTHTDDQNFSSQSFQNSAQRPGAKPYCGFCQLCNEQSHTAKRYVNFVESVFSHKTLHKSLPRSSTNTSPTWLSHETQVASVLVSHSHSSSDMASHETSRQNPSSSSRAWAAHPQYSLTSSAPMTVAPVQTTHQPTYSSITDPPHLITSAAPLHVAPVTTTPANLTTT